MNLISLTMNRKTVIPIRWTVWKIYSSGLLFLPTKSRVLFWCHFISLIKMEWQKKLILMLINQLQWMPKLSLIEAKRFVPLMFISKCKCSSTFKIFITIGILKRTRDDFKTFSLENGYSKSRFIRFDLSFIFIVINRQ